MKTIIRDFAKTLACVAAVITFIITFGSQTRDLFVNNHIIAIADGKISVALFADYIWYIRGGIALICVVLIYVVYNFMFGRLNLGLWPLVLLWLGFVLIAIHELAKPMPWYGLAFGLIFLYILGWFMYHAFFPDYEPSKTKT